MNKRSLLVTFVVSLFAISLTTPPALADASTNGLSGGAQKAASINDLKASDAQLVAAISTLNAEVAAQQASVDSAKQAVAASNQEVASINASMQQAQQQLDVVKVQAQARAVEQYMAPANNLQTELLSSNGIGDAERRDALFSQLSSTSYDALDQLKAVESDFNREHKAALVAQKTANERQATEQTKLDTLNAALADQGRLEASLKQRIAADNAEDSVSATVQTQTPGRASRGGDTQTTDDDTRISSEGLIWPVQGSHAINSPFGMRWGRMHEGIDIYATAGQPIYAAKAGTVTFSGQESGYGGYICIQHGGSFQTCYAHETKLLVSVGQQVTQGQELGLAGASGDATGVTLHFETCTSTGKECFYGQFHNPIPYLP